MTEPPTAKLALLRPDGAPKVISLGPSPVSLGRDPENTVVVEGPDVSRRHCTFVPLPGQRHAVLDLESTNGLVVNDRRVSKAVLEPFDRVALGAATVIYLATGTDTEKVLNLVNVSSSATSQLPITGEERLRDLLLWLILSLEGLGSEEEVYPLLGTVLDDLLERSGHECALLVQTREHDGVARLEPVQWRRVPDPALEAEGMAGCLSLVEEALSTSHITYGATPLASETVCVPMQSRPRRELERRRSPVDKVEGALLLGGARGELASGDQVLLQALLRQVAVIVANARLQQEASTDALTQLSSRGCIQATLVSEVERARDNGIPLGVILLDVDDFKRVNDTYGHSVGDEVLRQIGLRLRHVLRADDIAGRWGGEEFIVILPGTDLEGAQRVGDKIVRLIAKKPMGSSGIRATVSAGVCAFPEQASGPEDLVRRADLALYAAKRRGKDQTARYERALDTSASAPVDPSRTQRMNAVRITPDEDGPVVAWLHCDLFKPVALRPGVISLGRGQDCDVSLPHPSVSRVHGLISTGSEAGPIRYEDRSTNGSVLNERPVLGAVELNLGDRLEIGPFRFRLRLRRKDDTGHETLAGNVRVGRLESFPLCDLLSRLQKLGSEGIVSLCAAGGVGEVTLKAGEPWAARQGDQRGDEALRTLLSWRRGAFSFVEQEVAGPREVESSLAELLEG